MMWSDNSEEEKKLNIINVLSQMLKSDGEIAPIELTYITSLARSMGISASHVTRVINSEDSSIVIPGSEKDRMTILLYMLLLMKVDKHISREEEKLIFHFGFKLGFRDTLLRDFVETIKAYSHKALPPNILMDKVKKYLN